MTKLCHEMSHEKRDTLEREREEGEKVKMLERERERVDLPSSIQQILTDTKYVQKEINQLSGKLDRVFQVTDEQVFKVQYMYMMLVRSIHV